jgi:hypothetical protein
MTYEGLIAQYIVLLTTPAEKLAAVKYFTEEENDTTDNIETLPTKGE